MEGGLQSDPDLRTGHREHGKQVKDLLEPIQLSQHAEWSQEDEKAAIGILAKDPNHTFVFNTGIEDTTYYFKMYEVKIANAFRTVRKQPIQCDIKYEPLKIPKKPTPKAQGKKAAMKVGYNFPRGDSIFFYFVTGFRPALV